MEDPGFELVAASLRADATDLAAFVEALAVKLEGALPGSVRSSAAAAACSRARSACAASRSAWTRPATTSSATTGRCETSRCSEVRGIVIKSEPLDLDAWIEASAAS